MNMQEIKKLPLGAREMMAHIPNDEVDADPKVRELIDELHEAQRRHAETVAALREILDAQERARARAEDALGEIDAIESGRQLLAKMIILGKAHDDEDALQQARVADLRRLRESFALALLALEDDANVVRLRVGTAANRVADAQTELAAEREGVRARLALARWQA